jgi:hypothetical protein
MDEQDVQDKPEGQGDRTARLRLVSSCPRTAVGGLCKSRLLAPQFLHLRCTRTIGLRTKQCDIL